MRYLPALLGWYDDGDSPVLVIEDLSDATWPPPWSTEGVDAVLQALADVQATTTPTGIEDAFGALFDIHEGWDPMRCRSDRCAQAWGVRSAVVRAIRR